jgi:predicted nucleotidyltransferase
LEQLLDRPVDLVTEGSLADFARESVERDKILIYERAA